MLSSLLTRRDVIHSFNAPATGKGRHRMNPLLLLLALFASLVLLDIVALRWGADSRTAGSDAPDWW
jgi:hypothetical protein